MQAFINEKSAHEQCMDRPSVSRVVGVFITVADRLLSYKTGARRWLGPEIDVLQKGDARAECVLLSGAAAGTLSSTISDSLVRAQLDRVLGRLAISNWPSLKLQKDNVLYSIYQQEPVWDSSMAELAERRFQMEAMPCFLINFDQSRFRESRTIEVLREEEDSSSSTVSLTMIQDLADLETWAEAAGFVPIRYSPDSLYPPEDDQTILVIRSRFERTNLRVRGRVVYREINTRYYWYVDNFHYGRRAELEVFDANGSHFGAADLDGRIDQAKRVKGRRIDL